MADAQDTYLRASILSDRKNNHRTLSKQKSQDPSKFFSSSNKGGLNSKNSLLAKFNSIDHGSSYAEQDKNLILPLMDEDYGNKKKNKKRKLQRPLSSIDN